MKGGTLGNVPSIPPSREAGRAGRSRCLSTGEKNTSGHLMNRGNLASNKAIVRNFETAEEGGEEKRYKKRGTVPLFSPPLYERACILIQRGEEYALKKVV